MQKFGTAIRNEVSDDFWVKACLKDYEKDDNWLISDTRFKSEAKGIKDLEGIIVRVNREGAGAGNHISEIELDYYQFDYVINNDKKTLAKRRMVLAIALQMTLPGAPTIYYGDEMEMFGYADPFNRAPMDWNHGESEILRQTRLFTKLRSEKDCLRTGFYTLLLADEGLICYMRNSENGYDAFGKETDGEDVIVIVNARTCPHYINLNLDRYAVTALRDTLSGEIISCDGNLAMELSPLSYRVLSPERKKNTCTKIQSI